MVEPKVMLVIIIFIILIVFVIYSTRTISAPAGRVTTSKLNLLDTGLTYTSQLTILDNKPGNMILEINENKPDLDELLYSTGIYTSDTISLSIPSTTIIANGNAYICSSNLLRKDDSNQVQLQILKSDIPSSLAKIAGPWYIRTNFAFKTFHENIYDSNTMSPFASWARE